MTWTEDLRAKRTVWRGVEYDSVLEADWAATLTMWGMEFVYHPGRIFLKNGDIYEPDFQVDGDIMLEVKGGHNERIEKAERASRETGIPLVIGRASFLPAGSDVEIAGAVWEPAEDWCVRVPLGRVGVRFEPAGSNKDIDLYWSAHVSYARQLPGLRMFKAVNGERAV